MDCSADPQLRHRDWLVSMESGIWGTQHTDRFPAVLRDADGTELTLTYRASPYLGAHNFDVYANSWASTTSDRRSHGRWIVPERARRQTARG